MPASNVRAIVAAFVAPDADAKGVLRIDGRVVERRHLDQAKQVIAVAEAIAGAEVQAA